MRRAAALALALILAAPAPAAAGMPAFRRGLNADIWIDWRRVDEMLADPATLAPFPDWQRVLTPGRLALVAEQGFDFLRLPVDPAPLLALGPGPARAALLADMRRAVETALGAGLSVVVDLHAFPRPGEAWGADDVTGRLWPAHLALVAETGAALRGLPPGRVAFEPLNEPTLDCPAVWEGAPADWPAMLAQMHAVARAAAPDLALVLSGACWGGIEGLEALDPAALADERVIWSFHSYAPFAFTHQGAVWIDGAERFVSGLPYPPSALDPAQLPRLAAEAAARMAAEEGAADAQSIAEVLADYRATPDGAAAAAIVRAAAWADRHGIPRSRLILGEFGALRTAHGRDLPPEWQHRYLADVRAAAEARGIAWAVWNHAGDMGVADPADPDRRLTPGACAALGLACAAASGPAP